MFVVKRLGKNGMWSAISLIDKNGSFRGEAKFDTLEEAGDYMASYLDRMKSRVRRTHEGYGDVKIFDDSIPEKDDVKSAKSPKSTKAVRKHTSKK